MASRNARIRKVTDNAAVSTLAADAPKVEKIYKSLEDFPKERRLFTLAETVVHPGVQKRRQDINPEIGAVPASVDEIFDKLDEGYLTIERLLRRDPLVIAGIKNELGEVVKYVRVDGHTRIAAILRYQGNSAKAEVDYFECTERELYIASGSVNSENATPLSRNERIAMFTEYLNDKELVQLSDSALAELMAGQQQPRNIGNLRRSLIVKATKDLVRKGQRFEETLMTQVKKYAPRIRKGLDGREIDTSKIGGDLYETMLADPTFDDIRPKDETAEAPAAEQTTDQPVATTTDQRVDHTPAPVQTANFVPATGSLDEVSTPVATDVDGEPVADEPTTDEPATTGPINAEFYDEYDDFDGEQSDFDGVTFLSATDNPLVQIRHDGKFITVPVAALIQFVNMHQQLQNSVDLLTIAE
jgi:hypothetical protein